MEKNMHACTRLNAWKKNKTGTRETCQTEERKRERMLKWNLVVCFLAFFI